MLNDLPHMHCSSAYSHLSSLPNLSLLLPFFKSQIDQNQPSFCSSLPQAKFHSTHFQNVQARRHSIRSRHAYSSHGAAQYKTLDHSNWRITAERTGMKEASLLRTNHLCLPSNANRVILLPVRQRHRRPRRRRRPHQHLPRHLLARHVPRRNLRLQHPRPTRPHPQLPAQLRRLFSRRHSHHATRHARNDGRV